MAPPAAARAVKSLVTAAYDAAADQFALSADRWVYRRLARPLADALRGSHGPLLDVAAGTGALGRFFRQVVAVDISAGQLAHNPASRRVVADAERLPFPDDSFAAAGCAFGINHFPDPVAAVSEMARVAQTVGVLTWRRPEPGYRPKDVVNEVLSRRLGQPRSRVGETVDHLSDAVGSVQAVADLLAAACRNHRVDEVVVTVPWPGAEAYLDYRLGMPSTAATRSDPAIREEAAAALAALPAEHLDWQAALVLGVGER